MRGVYDDGDVQCNRRAVSKRQIAAQPNWKLVAVLAKGAANASYLWFVAL